MTPQRRRPLEISEIRKRVLATIDRARRTAAARRTLVDQAAREYDLFLERVAIPIFRMVGNALRAEGYVFTIFTPGGSVRLMSDRSSEDYIELALETSGPEPQVIGKTSRGRGRRVIELERPIGASGPICNLSETDVLDFVLKELEPFVER
jgi:hypothetical protein